MHVFYKKKKKETMRYKSMQKLFQKGGISDIASDKMTIFKNKMVFGR